jgi:hypothetical protein
MLQVSRLRKNRPGRAVDNAIKCTALKVPIKAVFKNSVKDLFSEKYEIVLKFEE